ncbi:MAG: RtcB family protein [Clostridia bacterium]|nr:RtcB family protein [Clostridia bacterium]
MYDIVGQYNTATVYATCVDPESHAQVLRMCNIPELRDCRIRMMPDMHASEGCTVGTSMTVGERVNPSYVGGDIGCGMQVYLLNEEHLDFALLDAAVRRLIPAGAQIHKHNNPAVKKVPLEELYCYSSLRREMVARGLGTLGGGNHFIEVDRGTDGRLYLVIHSGSRALGKSVALYHQRAAFYTTHGIDPEEAAKKRIRMRDVKGSRPPEECFLTGFFKERYLNDMNIAVVYAAESRKWMGETLINALGLEVADAFTTTHNYIDTAHGILRKGAVSAQDGERLIVPINMRDGSLICRGKGNPEWNYTAPHGAGRLMKRSDAKERFSLEEYQAAMAGIYTTSVDLSTIDESPMAYRSVDDIVDAITPTVEIVDIATPVYNFKASKHAVDPNEGED